MLRSALLTIALCSCAPPAEPVRAGGVVPAQKLCEPPQPMPPIPQSAPPNSTYLTTAAPPARYQIGNVKMQVEFVSPEEANRRCAAQPSGLPVCQRVFYACVQGGTMIMPNPCVSHGEHYADLLCHETGHRRGWPATHGD